jgi:hypothetical protein
MAAWAVSSVGLRSIGKLQSSLADPREGRDGRKG